MANTVDLITLGELHAYLDVADADTRRDALFALSITGVSRALERVTGGPLVQAAQTEQHWGGRRSIWLQAYPVVQITSIKDGQDVPEVIGADQYTIIAEIGQLEHCATWPIAIGPTGLIARWEVKFTAGQFTATATVDADVKLVALEKLAATMARKGLGISSLDSGDLSVAFDAKEATLLRDRLSRWLRNVQ